MNREKIYFAAGIAAGILLAVLFLFYFAPRYMVVQGEGDVIKQDRWTGQSWRFVDNNWKKVAEGTPDWEKIDGTLREALQIPFIKVDTGSALNRLREKYALLEEISDEELLERIKLVYSKQILCNLYLENFMKLQEGDGSVQRN